MHRRTFEADDVAANRLGPPVGMHAQHRAAGDSIAAWPGHFTGETLSYAEPGHPEARREVRPDARIITVV